MDAMNKLYNCQIHVFENLGMKRKGVELVQVVSRHMIVAFVYFVKTSQNMEGQGNGSNAVN